MPLGLVPAGSGNDGARAIGLPLDPSTALQCVMRGRLRQVDLARVGQRRYVSVLAAGFDARVSARTGLLPTGLGRLRYPLAALAALPTLQPAAYRLEVDGELMPAEAVLVAVANGSSYGGGMRIVPTARLDDGLLDVLVAAPVRPVQMLRLLPAVYRGGHVAHPAVRVLRARILRMHGPPLTAYADGEPVGELPLTVAVEPGALTVLA